jgi:hypothetical protein
MKARYELIDVDEIEATLKITMTVGDWKRLNEQLSAKWPSWKLSGLIDRITSRANSYFEEKEEVDE